jgi:hypothetical protein
MSSQIVLRQEPTELGDGAKPGTQRPGADASSELRQLVSSTKLVPRRCACRNILKRLPS